uniref:Uncharacterized protein n=1 Tax=Oryza punctata TaxID=4537 RepID=A0A0E0M430_ORYPU
MRPAATGRRSSSDAATATTARRKTRSAIGPPLPPHGHGPGLLHGIISVCLKRDASDALLVVVTVGIASGVVMAGLRPSPSRRLYPPCLRAHNSLFHLFRGLSPKQAHHILHHCCLTRKCDLFLTCESKFILRQP